jgi:hypothetical protein
MMTCVTTSVQVVPEEVHPIQAHQCSGVMELCSRVGAAGRVLPGHMPPAQRLLLARQWAPAEVCYAC